MYQIMKIVPVILILTGLAGSGLYAYDSNSEEFHNITDQLVCYLCGCNWVLSTCQPENCGYSKELRGKIGELLDKGATEKEVIQSMVGMYGERILGAPLKRGFNWSAYLLPFLALMIGGIFVAVLADKWVRAGTEGWLRSERNDTSDEGEPPVEVKHRDRIEAELEAFDRSHVAQESDR